VQPARDRLVSLPGEIDLPAAVVSELELNGYAIERV
jgi:hypothetical protein